MNRFGKPEKKESKLRKLPFFLASMSGRFTSMLVIVAFFCIIMVASVAVRFMGSVERDRMTTSMMKDAQQINDTLHQEYLSLVSISQQLIPYGYIGLIVEDFISAQSPYDRIIASKMVSNNINLILFATPQIELLQYFTEDTPTLYDANFTSMAVKSNFSPLDIPVSDQIQGISFHSIHNSGNRHLDNAVISLIHAVSFSDNIDRYVYVEYRTNVVISLSEIVASQGIPYNLIQIDHAGKVLYSEMPLFPEGSIFPKENSSLKNIVGRDNGYVWCAVEEVHGVQNILLLPESYYDRESNVMMQELVFVSLLSIAIILVIGYTFRNSFYRPMMLLEEEMKAFAQGEKAIKTYHFNVQEYDSLFQHFAQMKTDITELMDNIKEKEREKLQLELDKLYFQINPHFLMNALNSAQWQALMGQQSDLAEYLSCLNFLLAYSLGKVSNNTTLRSELKHLKSYLELQQTRQDFQVHYDVEEGIYLDRECARLILQPIAENAICHSINDFGNIWISVCLEEDKSVKILIRDDGQGFDPQKLSFKVQKESSSDRQTKNGIGLRYVWLSLSQFYQGKAKMTVDSGVGLGTTVRLYLPSNTNPT